MPEGGVRGIVTFSGTFCLVSDMIDLVDPASSQVLGQGHLQQTSEPGTKIQSRLYVPWRGRLVEFKRSATRSRETKNGTIWVGKQDLARISPAATVDKLLPRLLRYRPGAQCMDEEEFDGADGVFG